MSPTDNGLVSPEMNRAHLEKRLHSQTSHVLHACSFIFNTTVRTSHSTLATASTLVNVNVSITVSQCTTGEKRNAQKLPEDISIARLPSTLLQLFLAM